MARTTTMKRGDTAPPLEATLYNRDGALVDLTGVTSVTLKIRAVSGTTVFSSDEVEVLAPTNGGLVRYEWGAGDTEGFGSGRFFVEWEVVFADGALETFPSRYYNELRITDDLREPEPEPEP